MHAFDLFIIGYCNFYYSLLGIETIKFDLIAAFKNHCNFYYSLLGIETGCIREREKWKCHCNFYYSLLGIETSGTLTNRLTWFYCNFYYSLLGIETISEFAPWLLNLRKLQFLLLPIRDWNCHGFSLWHWGLDCNFYYSLLGIETPIRKGTGIIPSKLQFLLLPIRDWNPSRPSTAARATILQFLLLPIRDWNLNTAWIEKTQSGGYCNFYYSLLGIETIREGRLFLHLEKLQFLLLPIRDWNLVEPLTRSVMDLIAISITPY